MADQAQAAGSTVKPAGVAVGPLLDGLARKGDRGFKAEVDSARDRMRGLGFGHDQIAAELARRYRLRPREAYRVAHGWTLNQAAARFNARAAEEAADPHASVSMTGPHICEHERWPCGGHKPSAHTLALLAKVYDTDVGNLLDLGDHENIAPADRPVPLQTTGAGAGTPEPAAERGTFASELRRLLAASGLPQRQLALRVPCDPGFLSKLINGHKKPSRKMAARLDELLSADGRLIAHISERQAGAKRDRTPRTVTAHPPPQPSVGGISVTLPYVPGRLVIEVSGLETASAAAPTSRAGHVLRLAPTGPGQPAERGGGRAG